MPTVIDALIVELQLDPAQFDEGRKQAAAAILKTKDELGKTSKAIEADAKRAAEFFTGIKNAAVGLFAVLVGTDMARFARDTVTTVSATGRLAHNIGISTANLSAFAQMVKMNGGNANEAAASFQNLTQTLEQWKALGVAPSREFQIGLGTVGGNLEESPLAIYMKFVQWADAHRNDPQLVNTIGRTLGLDQGSINAAEQGLKRVTDQLAQARRFAPSDADAKKLQQLQASWSNLDQAIAAVGRDLVLDAADPMDRVAKDGAGWIQRNREVADSIGAITSATAALAALKPAAWLLRMIGLGSMADVAAGGASLAAPLALAGAQGALTYESNKFLAQESGGVIVGTNPLTGEPIYAKPLSALPGNGTGAPSKNTATLQDRALSYFVSQGWTTPEAAALVANAQAESGLNPSARNAGHQGLFQWSKARRDAILAGTGIDVWNASFDDQLRAAQWELTVGPEKAAGAGLRGITDPAAGAMWLDRNYERSGDTSLLQLHRGMLAQGMAARTSGAPSVETHIQSIHVNAPHATDAAGVARAIGGTLRDQLDSDLAFAVQANTGLA